MEDAEMQISFSMIKTFPINSKSLKKKKKTVCLKVQGKSQFSVPQDYLGKGRMIRVSFKGDK